MINLTNKKNGQNGKPAPGAPQAAPDSEEFKTRLELLYEVALQVSSLAEVSELIDQILEIIQDKLDGTASSLMLVDEKKGELYFQAAGGKAARSLKQMSFTIGEGIAGWVVQHRKPVVVNDVSRDKRFNQSFDARTGFRTRSIIAAPLVKGKSTIGVIEVLNKADDQEFDTRDLSVISGFCNTEALILLVSMAHMAINNITAKDRQWLDGYMKTAEALAQASDAKDTYTIGHSERVRDYAIKAARNLELSDEDFQAIEFGALLHDIGKMGIDEKILRKPGSLTDEEWATMQEHPVIGANMVGEIPLLEKAKLIILHHHERYDGTGYPKGLKGEEIPLGARVVAICDAFDTMTTEQSYSTTLSVEEAIDELVSGNGSHFCPIALKAFIAGVDPEHGFLKEKADERKPAAGAAAPEDDEIVVQKLARIDDEDEGDDGNDELQTFEGEVTLEIANVSVSAQVKRIYKILGATDSLKISMAGWSEEKGHIVTVHLGKPMPLLLVLGGIPGVDRARVSGKKTITVTME